MLSRYVQLFAEMQRTKIIGLVYPSLAHICLQEVICRTPEGPISITTYAEVCERAKLCALALRGLGMRLVERN
jgi:hypothetical protein